MARHGIYQKSERSLIKSFVYICEGLVLVHRHFLKPRNVSCKLKNEKMKKYSNYKHMKVIFIIIITLFSQVLMAQRSNKLLFDYTNYSLTNILKVHNELVTINSPFFLDYQNISKNKLTSSDFDLNKDKSVKKITVYDHSNGKFKLFEIDFYENGKIKSQKSYNDYLYTFEYLDTLEIRKAISKGNEVIVDSIFSDRKGKIIYSTYYSKNRAYEGFESEKVRHFYDNLDRKILEYKRIIYNFSNHPPICT